MADSTVGFVVGRLAEFVAKEAKVLQGVERDVVLLRDKLQWLHTFVQLADQRRRLNGNAYVDVWVQQTRDVSLEVEDVIDRFMVRVNLDQHLPLWSKCLKFLTACATQVTVRRELSGRIAMITARLNQISKHRRDYIHKYSSQTLLAPSMPVIDGWDEEVEIFGFDTERSSLLTYLLEGGKERSITSIVGESGMGKSTLARSVYDSSDVRKSFKVHVWINISPCFEEPDILYSINKHLSSGARAKAESPQEILEALNLTLKTKKYLIVLDGITKLLNWSSVLDALPENNKGSRLVIITSLKESEGALNGLSCVHELRVNELPLGDRVSLFLRNACGSRKNPVIVSAGSRGLFGELESRTMENAYEDMLEITNGLPLAIVLLGRLLRRKEFPGQWNEVLKHLKLKKPCNPLEGLLALCFEDLPHDLRPCFLHFALRPENTIYSARRLVRLWVAEGFLQHTKGETMEDVGHTYLKELVSRGMIHLIKKESEGEIMLVTIHQQLHAMARSETYYQATFLDVYGQTYVPSSAAVRHIFLNNIRNANIHMDSRFPNLRSVLCAFPNNWERAEAVGGATAITSDDHYLGHFGKSELLRVIELTGLQVKKVPHVIGNLIHLRYLCIRSPCLVELPSSIGNLINLQTLDIAKSSVKKLSASFWKISTLRHVIAERLDLPESVGVLKNMQALMGLVCLHPWHGNISPLHNMVNLRKLKISGLTSSHSAALSDAFSKLELLIHLEIIGTDIPSTLFTNFSMRRLQSLQLTGKMIMQTADTEQRCTLPSLTKLVLKNSKVNHGFIDMVGKLPCLAELRLLSRSYDGQQLTFSPASGFGNLTDLVIRNLPELSLLTIQSESLPKVRKITVGDCNKMRLNDLEGEQVLINLTEFKVINMPDNWGLQEGSTFINDKFFRVSAPQNNGAAQMPESRNRFDIWCRRLRPHLPCQGRGKQGPGLPHQAL